MGCSLPDPTLAKGILTELNRALSPCPEIHRDGRRQSKPIPADDAECCCTVSCSVVSDSSETLWTVAQQAPLSMGFSRQECWSEPPFPSPGDLPEPGIELVSPALAGGFFTTEPPGKP